MDTTAQATGSERLEHVRNGKAILQGSRGVVLHTHSVAGPGDRVTVAPAVDVQTETLLSGGARRLCCQEGPFSAPKFKRERSSKKQKAPAERLVDDMYSSPCLANSQMAAARQGQAGSISSINEE